MRALVARRSRFSRPSPVLGMFATAAILGTVGLIPRVTPVHAQTRTDHHTAVVTSAGITIEVDTKAWRGEPRRFDKVVPVLVRITNQSDIPLRIRHANFTLVTTMGERVPATPPFDLRATETAALGTPIYPFHGFHSFGHGSHGLGHGRFPFGHFGRFGHAGRFGYPYSPFGHFSHFRSVRLPTSDMVAMALPELVVEPGDRVTGFIYFVDDDDHVDLDHAGRVDLRAELVNAETRASFVAIGIPLVAKSDRLEIADPRDTYVEGNLVQVDAETDRQGF